MSWASAGLALPANSAKVLSPVLMSLCAVRVSPSRKLAGVEGFEPPNGGIKTRCLTTWRHPSICPPAEKRAGAHLTAVSVPPPVLEKLMHGRCVKAPRDVARPAIRYPRCQALGLRSASAGCEHAGAGPSQAGRGETPEPLQGLANLRKLRAHHRLAVVTAPRLKKGGYCDQGRISCQFRALEHSSGADVDRWV